MRLFVSSRLESIYIRARLNNRRFFGATKPGLTQESIERYRLPVGQEKNYILIILSRRYNGNKVGYSRAVLQGQRRDRSYFRRRIRDLFGNNLIINT